MLTKQDLPVNVQEKLNKNKIEFIVEGKQSVAISNFLGFYFGFFLILLPAYIFYAEILSKIPNYNFEYKNFFLIIITILFFIFGLILFFSAVSGFFSKKVYFIGTGEKLLIFNLKGKQKEAINWNKFIGHIVIQGNIERGTIIFKKGGRNNYLRIFMANISHPYQIAKIIKQKI